MQLTQVARKGEWGQIFVVKDVYERYLRHPNLANSCPEENATETSTLGVLYPALMGLCQYISAWAIELLILDKAMREPGCGIGEVEHPRLSV